MKTTVIIELFGYFAPDRLHVVDTERDIPQVVVIPSFMELWRNYMYGFMQRFINSDNSVVAATVSACRMSSALWRRWESVLYT